MSALRRFKPYPAYKDSGVEWLGEIPAHWEVKPLKHLTAFTTGWTPPSGQEDLYGGDHLWANISDLGPRVLMTTDKTISDAAIRVARLQKVNAGSLLFSFKLSVGTVSIAGVEMFTNEAIAAFAPSPRIDTQYLYWAAPALVPRNAQENIYGAPLLNRDRIANARLISPPSSEQRAIAAFLDRETARIDALVAKKERLIELLQEKRTALITRAVTKGLDPTVPMKDSGVEWLGEIPAHWELKRLRHALRARPRNGISPPIGVGGDVPTFSTAAVNDGEVLIDENIKYTMLEQREAQPFIVAIGDIFLLRGSGSRDIVGRAGILKKEPPIGCIYPDILIRVQPSRLMTPWFLVNSLNSAAVRFQIESLAQTASGIWKISGEDVRTLAIPVPPYDEQLHIRGEVSRQIARLDALVAKVRDAVDRLKELRTALISAAVTGKIDVREEAAP